MFSNQHLNTGSIEHGQVTSILATGYPIYIGENQDTSEARDEFIEASGNACIVSYQDWLN